MASKRISGVPSKREEYSLELLNLMEERKLTDAQAWVFRDFTHKILQIDKNDIAPKIKEVWEMQFKPQDEVFNEIYNRSRGERMKKEGIKEGIKEGREENKIEIARNLLTNGVSLDIIAKSTGLGREEILMLG